MTYSLEGLEGYGMVGRIKAYLDIGDVRDSLLEIANHCNEREADQLGCLLWVIWAEQKCPTCYCPSKA